MRPSTVLPLIIPKEDIYLNRAACNHRSAQDDTHLPFRHAGDERAVPTWRGWNLHRIAESTRCRNFL